MYTKLHLLSISSWECSTKLQKATCVLNIHCNQVAVWWNSFLFQNLAVALSAKIGIGLKKWTHIHSAYCEEKSCLGVFAKSLKVWSLRGNLSCLQDAYLESRKAQPYWWNFGLSIIWFSFYKLVLTTFPFSTGMLGCAQIFVSVHTR